MGETLRR